MSNARQTFTVNDKGMEEFISDIKSRLHLKEDDEIEVVQSLTQLTIAKKGPFCFFCGSDEDLRTLGKGKLFCKKCLEAMGNTHKTVKCIKDFILGTFFAF